jgi:hypothetical protein
LLGRPIGTVRGFDDFSRSKTYRAAEVDSRSIGRSSITNLIERTARSVGEAAVKNDVTILALVKGQERYVFLFDDAHRTEMLRTLGRFAADPELSFTWSDAVNLSEKVKQASDDPGVFNNRFILPMSSNDERE